MRVATSGVERVGAEHDEGASGALDGRRHGRGGDEEGGERSGEGEAR